MADAQAKTLDPNAAMEAALLNTEECIECLVQDIANATACLDGLKKQLRARLQEQTRLRTALGLPTLHPRKSAPEPKSKPEGGAVATKQDQKEG